MLVPSIFGENLFDDFFEFPDTRELERADRKLYGRHPDRVMKTDVHEHEDHFEVDIDLPGFKKDDISLELENGFLTVSATKNVEENKEHKGKLIRQERYTGSLQRTFQVGEDITEDEIKAAFKDGVLSLTLPKKEQPKIPQKKTIAIEG